MISTTEAYSTGGKKRAQAMVKDRGFVDPADHRPQDFGLKRSPEPEHEAVIAYLGKDMICPLCSKEFLRPTEKWAYKVGGKFYCSYKCMRIVARGGA